MISSKLTFPLRVSRRCLSSYSGARDFMEGGALAQYGVFGEQCMLSMKVLPPVFKQLRNGLIVIDGNKKGRLLLDLIPRRPMAVPDPKALLRFALSAEEIGLLLDQLPDHEVELVRRTPRGTYDPIISAGGLDELPEKILRVTPAQGGVVNFKVDYEKDGVGGQPPPGGHGLTGPLEVTVQRGEFIVMMELMKTSIPLLSGWSPLINMTVQRCVKNAASHASVGMSGGFGGDDSPF